MISDNYIEAMKAIIGSLIIDPEYCADDIFTTIRPEHFADETLREIFISAAKLRSEGRLDRLALLHDTPQYRGFITEVVDLTPTARNYREYRAMLFDEYKMHSAELSYERMRELRKVGDMDGIETELDELKGTFNASSLGSMYSSDDQFYAVMEEMGKESDYIGFGINALDKRLQAERGDYIVIGARPSVGKTAFGINIAAEIAKKYRTLFFSLETGHLKLAYRYIAAVTGIDFVKMRNHDFTEEEQAIFMEKYPETKGRDIHFVESWGYSAREICAFALREKAEVIFVDYLGLVSGQGRTDYERVSAISKYFHTFAQKHRITIVALAQLNREATRGVRPDLDNLRDSGQVEQDADAVILLHKPLEEDNMREVILAKNKEGETGSFALDFDGRRQKFFPSLRAEQALKNSRSGKGGYGGLVGNMLGRNIVQ
ncbi:MAG: hypothetical protein E7432_09445 [Ruminococcaceae bacterium]|nr:hypothetical protein [Oscillospiraceae bacterium]